MKWFGKHWGAPICDLTPSAERPVGQPCVGCTRTIKPDEDGLIIPFESETIEQPWHLDCLLQNIGFEVTRGNAPE